MTVTLIDRATVRGQLAALLTTGLVGTGKPVQAVYSYRIGDFGGRSPIVIVTSDGSDRSKLAQVSRAKTTFSFIVYVFVVYNTMDGNWTEGDAETRLDLIEKTISQIVIENDSVPGQWAILSRSESKTDDVELGGALYRREIIPVEVTLYEN